eukprot:TRINITY_DN43246_c0_g1_i1.p1 TRINITY_DN43246_c0_g1~~TRINITY_DN43246_c0_g1_i1.p1  ORF type:complete len:468 (+),score=70.13 TRINITY_DN43246_c0_g1_i1:59-1405(+)
MVAAGARAFACPYGQPTELPAGEVLWPIREDQKPEVVHSVEEFMEALQLQEHLERVVVLPNGIDLLGQKHALPQELCQASRGSCSVRQMMAAMGPQSMRRFRARLWHYSEKGREKEIKVPKEIKAPNRTSSPTGRGVVGDRKSLLALQSQLMLQEEKGVVDSKAALYISELRWQRKVKHPLDQSERVKTATNIDVFDRAPFARYLPLWERSEGGIFIGERGAGSGMHVDQCLWSNVGRNWCGFKLFALWPWSDRHSILDDAGKGAIFHIPLSAREESFLKRAKTIALIRPGDVWVFSGGQPHTALVVGDGLNVSAYESLVPANVEAMRLLLRSNMKDAHWKGCWMDDDDLDELYEDVVDTLQSTLRNPKLDQSLRDRLEACREAMRTSEDSYCKELWVQEDRGERKRRREEESSSSSEDMPKREEEEDDDKLVQGPQKKHRLAAVNGT